MQEIWKFMSGAGVYSVKIDQCKPGAVLPLQGDDGKEEPVLSHSGFLTSSKEIAKSLDALMFKDRDKGDLKSVKSLLEVLMKDIETDAKRCEENLNLYAMELCVHVDEDAVDFDNPLAELAYYDDISGGVLDPVRVLAARREEVDFVHESAVYRKVPRASAVGGQFVTFEALRCLGRWRLNDTRGAASAKRR